MACDFSVAAGHASFGQAGPVHGSAPDGGSTDFLHLHVGYARAAESLVLCEPWSAYKAERLGLINEVVAVHRTPEGAFVPDPRVVTDRWLDKATGLVVHGEWKTGAALEEAKAFAAGLEIDLAPLDRAVDALVTRLLYTFPDCTRKTLESLRKKKLEHWFANSETNRSWLSLNMATEASAGFPAFHYGARGEREIDFVALRRAVAEGRRFDRELVREVLPASAREAWEEGLAEEPAPEPVLEGAR